MGSILFGSYYYIPRIASTSIKQDRTYDNGHGIEEEEHKA